MSDTRTYRGTSLDEILPRIREELGPDAVITRQREGTVGGVGGFFAKRMVEVEARPAHPDVRASLPPRFARSRSAIWPLFRRRRPSALGRALTTTASRSAPG